MCRYAIALLFAIIVSGPVQANAAGIDGSAPFICAFAKAMECSEEDGCQAVSLQSLDLARFVRVDMQQKKVTALRDNARTTVILNDAVVDGKLILQGTDEAREGVRGGVGWTVAVMQDTGNMVLTAAGDDVGFVVFGACTRQ